MSYDVYLEIDTGGEHPARIDDGINYTYNMSYAIRHGGIEMYRRGLEASHFEGRFILDGSLAGAAAEELKRCITAIERDAVELRRSEPENRWGSVDSLLEQFLRPIMEMCRKHPKATVRVC